VDVSVAVVGDSGADGMRSLYEWLAGDDELRGRIRLRPTPAAPGTLGPVLNSLVIALGPGGVATATASVLISWIRHRTGNQSVRITRPDGTSFELTVTRVRGLDAAGVRDLVAEISRSLLDDDTAVELRPAAGPPSTGRPSPGDGDAGDAAS
jgi:Effector Associated Constant Component 1